MDYFLLEIYNNSHLSFNNGFRLFKPSCAEMCDKQLYPLNQHVNRFVHDFTLEYKPYKTNIKQRKRNNFQC